LVSGQINEVRQLPTDTLIIDTIYPKNFVQTFIGTRLINFHTVEMHPRGTLDFRISHRFGDISMGSKNLWGLDGPANIRLGLDYSLMDYLIVGIGRTANRKLVDGFIKVRILGQEEEKGFLSLVWVSSVNVFTEKDPGKAAGGAAKYLYSTNRLAYMHQLLVARKFSEQFSLQVAPTFIHYNLVEKLSDKNDMFMIPISARFKISKKVAITSEYGLRTFKYVRDKNLYYNSASLGFDLGTGGHVFQVFVSNSFGINEIRTLPYTTSSWKKGQLSIGFNINRLF
jgi:hypothetical protein